MFELMEILLFLHLDGLLDQIGFNNTFNLPELLVISAE